MKTGLKSIKLPGTWFNLYKLISHYFKILYFLIIRLLQKLDELTEIIIEIETPKAKTYFSEKKEKFCLAIRISHEAREKHKIINLYFSLWVYETLKFHWSLSQLCWFKNSVKNSFYLQKFFVQILLSSNCP